MTTPNTPNAAERPRLTKLYREVSDAALKARLCSGDAWERETLYNELRELENAFVDALAAADSHHPAESVSAEPVAWVPVHPRNGYLWANTTGDPCRERLPSYELVALYLRPHAPGAVSDEDVEVALRVFNESRNYDGNVVGITMRAALESFAKRSAAARAEAYVEDGTVHIDVNLDGTKRQFSVGVTPDAEVWYAVYVDGDRYHGRLSAADFAASIRAPLAAPPAQAVSVPEGSDWYRDFCRPIAERLNCLPSSFADGNAHILRALDKLISAASAAATREGKE